MLAALMLLLVTPTGTDDSRLLTGLVAAAAAEDPRADVLTAADLKSALEVEADKQLLSCDAARSCLAEIAAALDASIVISGTLDQLDDERVLQLSAFDAKRASSAGRQTARATTTKELARAADDATRRLVQPLLTALPPGTRLRILVLDVDAADTAGATAPAPVGLLALAGGGLGVVGVVGVVVGVFADQAAAGLHATVVDKSQNVATARAARDDLAAATAASVVGWSAGVVGLVAGVALVVVDVAGGAE